LISKPSSSTSALSSSTSPKPTFTPDVVGTYVASLVVSDGKDRSPTAVVTVIASAANSLRLWPMQAPHRVCQPLLW
jgi:hypothetical protein